MIARLFVPGQEGFGDEDARTSTVMARVLALSDGESETAYADVVARTEGRHRDIVGTFRRHAAYLTDRLDPERSLSDTRRLLLGATFTNEYAVEGAALCNPSMVAHPDQAGVRAGEGRVVMSVRCIGEGHRSSIGFRTGTVDAGGRTTFEQPVPFATTAAKVGVPIDAASLAGELKRLGAAGDTAAHALEALGPRFTRSELDERIRQLRTNATTRRRAEPTIAIIESVADRSYGSEFAADTTLSERILWPAMRAEQHGMEDARFVRFVHDDGKAVYFATYTAYDGSHIGQQLLETDDFRTFTSTPLTGAAAANKGLALFPRRIGGRFAALSRSDRETNSVAFSDDLRVWPASVPVQRPEQAWEVLQLGNCGSPIETDQGWLVLTHGVGPLRTYSIGALLLDLDDPTHVIGKLARPLLMPSEHERDGYVPNVVYSCGSLVVGRTLVVPYGIGDLSIGVATVAMPDLLAALTSSQER
ncbi:MAG TPA: glycoside hydrolase family 130 protein [Acidimicrobiales bacterium]|nr:glycoside hydrolase family 130 protein [Acidimicrobiales bacterium]